MESQQGQFNVLYCIFNRLAYYKFCPITQNDTAILPVVGITFARRGKNYPPFILPVALIDIMESYRWIFLLCLGLLFGGKTSAIADMLDGAAAYERGDYLCAMEEWLPYAARDDANALYNLGQLYRRGKGVEPDLERAEYYYLKAAELNNVLAQNNLGTMYYFSPSPIGNVEKAIHWWNKAARNGHAPAQHSIGLLYLNGYHIPKDQVKAYAWLYLSAQANLEQAIAVEKQLASMMTPDQIAAARDLALTLLETEKSPGTTVLPSLDISSRPEERSVAAAVPVLLPKGLKKKRKSRINCSINS